jgi:multiple sugar transport system ATP-binding protein
MAEIVLEGVGKTYPNGFVALQPTSMTIADGEFFILVGPSGCGKSTLLNLIVGLEDITEGEMYVGGVPYSGVDPKDRDFAMVFQSYAIYPHMTVRENIAFPLKLKKVPAEELRSRVDGVAEMLELTELLDRKPAQLSGGQRQRVAMGRAVVRDAKAFLMDEPLSNLDAKLRVQMRTEIAELQSRLGVTTVYVTHDQTEALTLGDRVAVMRRGVVQQVGTPKELYLDPANLFVAGFVGSPAMNFLPGEVRDGVLSLPLGDVPLSDGLATRFTGADGPVIAGIRPEDIEDWEFVDEAVRDRGPRFRAQIDHVEWLGSEVYAYFELETPEDPRLSELLSDVEGVVTPRAGRQQLTGRLNVSTSVRPGREADLWCNGDRIVLFDPGTGSNLSHIDVRDSVAV